MKVLHNPSTGAPISGFVAYDFAVDSFYPEGVAYFDATQKKEIVSNGLMQFPDNVALALYETFPFLKYDLTEDDVKRITARPKDAAYICGFPGCDYKTDVKIGLISHQRKHKNKDGSTMAVVEEQVVVDPSLVPVAKSASIKPLAQTKQMIDNEEEETQNGHDKDGVEWYGSGLKIEKPASFKGVDSIEVGHFKG